MGEQEEIDGPFTAFFDNAKRFFESWFGVPIVDDIRDEKNEEQTTQISRSSLPPLLSTERSSLGQAWLLERLLGEWRNCDCAITDDYEALMSAFGLSWIAISVMKKAPAQVFTYEIGKAEYDPSRCILRSHIQGLMGKEIKQQWDPGAKLSRGLESTQKLFGCVSHGASQFQQAFEASPLETWQFRNDIALPWSALEADESLFEDIERAQTDGNAVALCTDIHRLVHLFKGNNLKKYKDQGMPRYLIADDIIIADLEDASDGLHRILMSLTTSEEDIDAALCPSRDLVVQTIIAYQVEWRKGDKLGRWKNLSCWDLRTFPKKFQRKPKEVGRCEKWMRRISSESNPQINIENYLRRRQLSD